MYKTLLTITSLIIKVFGETKVIPSSCANLEDGLQYIKPMDGDEYPLLKLKCSNGYAILDYSLDSDIESYFTSFLKWHPRIAGPSQAQHINLEEWFIPDDGNTQYLVSESCDVCDESIQEYGTKNGYYMNANIFGCFVFPRGMPDCDFDFDTLECHACYADYGFATIYTTEFGADDQNAMGGCMTWVRESSAAVDTTYDECSSQTETGWKPTIGTESSYCLCVKPSTTEYYSVDSSLITEKENKLESEIDEKISNDAEEASKQEAGWDYQTVFISATDFSTGTYRIKEPGTYYLMEDVEFDFNSGDISDDPNNGAWWPADNDANYPGWGDTRDAFFMGFFSGITIESSNVILDLNGHKLSQSLAFFYQQGFFSDIEVSSQSFIPGQGVGFFGSDPSFPENVVIRNGYLGRTSHHCIHGNNNKNLLIENIVCSEFGTHGIQLNGFEDLTMRNVEVGPSNDEQYLSSEYTHYRFVLDRMMRIIDQENPTNTILFTDRPDALSLSDLYQRLHNEMNYAIKYVMLDEEGDKTDDEWNEAKKLFVNDGGLGYGASIYGIFLSYPGANVLSYHINSKISHHATLENIYIHDISHKTKEYAGLKTDLRMFVNSFNAPLSVEHLIGETAFQKLKAAKGKMMFDNSYDYKGSILTDVTIAMHEMSQNWGFLQIMYLLTDELAAWAQGEDSETALGIGKDGDVSYMCAVDGMVHATKGTFGMRIDGVDSVEISTMVIENIVEHGEVGFTFCGQCTKCAFESRTPYQIGYAGNMAQGISADYATNFKITDLQISNVESKTGRAIGFSVWPGTDVTLDGTIDVSSITAGDEIEEGTYSYEDRPNAAPESCAIRVYDSVAYSEYHDDNDLATVTISDNAVITSSCVEGHASCWNVRNSWTQIGDYQECSDNNEDQQSSHLKNKIKNNMKIATHKYLAKTSNYSVPILIFSSMIVYIGLVYWYITRCVIKKDPLLNNNKRQEIIPLLNYGSIQRN